MDVLQPQDLLIPEVAVVLDQVVNQAGVMVGPVALEL
jgi:hypothetical protein